MFCISDFALVLLPSFVANTLRPEERQRHNFPSYRRQILHSTSYLDGLRGIASVLVFICHYTEKRHIYLLPTYGHSQIPCLETGDVGYIAPSSFLQLPFVRVLYSGRPMVHIFFVISGLVLAFKPLYLLHGLEGLEACYAALASSVFRRPIRLFLPCAASTLIVAVFCQTGQLYAADITWSGQLSSWAHNYAGRIAWPWAWDRDLRPGYNIHLWTIPIEFAHAMLLFLVLLALAPLRTRLRQMATVMLAGYCLVCGRWAAFEFLSGLFLAELHVLRTLESRKLDSFLDTSSYRTSPLLHTVKMAFHSLILVACLFVFGWPNEGADRTPGLRTLVANTPFWFLVHGQDETGPEDWGEFLLEQKFWFGISAVLFVWSCGELAAARRQFERPLAQYFGRISYSVYLVHGPALDYWKDLADNLVRPIGMEMVAQRMTTWLLGLLMMGSLIVWLADLFWRLVDAPIVALGHRIERACLQDNHGAEGS